MASRMADLFTLKKFEYSVPRSFLTCGASRWDTGSASSSPACQGAFRRARKISVIDYTGCVGQREGGKYRAENTFFPRGVVTYYVTSGFDMFREERDGVNRARMEDEIVWRDQSDVRG